MRILAALGGAALLHRGEVQDVPTQQRNAREAARALAALTHGHELIVTHGNGPQVGLLARQSAPHDATEHAPPLDVLGAESEGLIGYVLTQELGNALPGREVVTLLTRVLVDAKDPAFAAPATPIGRSYPTEQAAWAAAHAQGWAVADDGDVWRRVVASPQPREIVELPTIRRLVDAGVLVVCAGGGGVPVVRTGDGTLRGAEAIIDKDLTAALLADAVGADALLLLTDVDGIQQDWGRPRSVRVPELTAGLVDTLDLEATTMRPKAQAAARFARATGGLAVIGRLPDAARMLAGEAGTRVTPGPVPGPARAVTATEAATS
jgi:carbamate kinase